MRVLAATLSVVLHGLLILGMSALPGTLSVAAPQLVEMKVVRKEPPPPPPPPPVEEKKEERPPPEVKPKLVKKRTVEKVVLDEPKPKPAEPEKKEEPPPPQGFSVDMSATSVGGGVAVPAIEGGGNMFANPNEKKEPGKKVTERPAEETGKGRGTAPASAYQVTRLPEFLGSEHDRTPPYPDSAKQREIEGQVLLKVFVGTTGRVEEVRVVRRLDPACDEVAVKWAREKFRFKPAMAGDEPVGMWIDVPVTFVIER